MRKKQSKTVQFSNLSEDHKAEFIQFLIKNNICFQEGKENCTAKVDLKQNQTFISKNKAIKENNLNKKTKLSTHQNKRMQSNDRHTIKNTMKRPTKPLGEIQLKNQTANRTYKVEEKELKTPTKNNATLRNSSFSCKEKKNNTLQKQKKTTPKSVRPKLNCSQEKPKTQVSDYEMNTRSVSKNQTETRKVNNSKDKVKDIQQRQRSQTTSKAYKQSQRPVNKYHHLFDSVEKGRAVRWPLNMLQRTIEELYDDIFTKNTQCLQTRNIDHALKTLNLTSIPQLIENYFFKKFKSSKLASTNLNNLLYSLSYHTNKSSTPIFLRTFEDFLEDRLQYEDILYYLFARNVLKRQLRVVERIRELSRSEGTYFTQAIRSKDVQRLLRGIIGRDSQLLSLYKQIIFNFMAGDEIEVYQFLRILLDDFHDRRLLNSKLEQTQSEERPLYEEASYGQKNEQLTFGEEQYSHNDGGLRRDSFWECLNYVDMNSNSLFELITEKMSQKSLQFLEILASDMSKPQSQVRRIHKLLLKKAESLTKAVFQMNKMKWFRQLSISDPSQDDMGVVENVQMRLKRLRQSPSGKDIGEFCKSILTVYQLVNELEWSLTATNDI